MKKLGPEEYAFYLLKSRDRSIGEIRQKMTLRKCEKEEIEKIILFLTDKKFLDDERFARNFVRNQRIIKPTGNYLLAQKLKLKFISPEIIKNVLADQDDSREHDLAQEAAEKWLKIKYQALSTRYQGDERKIRDNLSRHLMSRGFSWDVVSSIVENILKIIKTIN